MSGQHDSALHHFETALRINPNGSHAIQLSGYCLALMGNPQKGLKAMHQAMRLNPYPTDWNYEALGEILYLAEDYDGAVKAFNRMIYKPAWIYGYLAAGHA